LCLFHLLANRRAETCAALFYRKNAARKTGRGTGTHAQVQYIVPTAAFFALPNPLVHPHGPFLATAHPYKRLVPIISFCRKRGSLWQTAALLLQSPLTYGQKACRVLPQIIGAYAVPEKHAAASALIPPGHRFSTRLLGKASVSSFCIALQSVCSDMPRQITAPTSLFYEAVFCKRKTLLLSGRPQKAGAGSVRLACPNSAC
jgi:hypothetical protein